MAKQATSAIVDVGGVGYDVAIPLSTFYELGEVGEPVQLRVYDTRGGYATQSFTIEVAGGNRAPALDLPVTQTLREGEEGGEKCPPRCTIL